MPIIINGTTITELKIGATKIETVIIDGTIVFQSSKPCGTCNGRGYVTCPECDGSGNCYYCDGSGDCHYCDGSGFVDEWVSCETCYGMGNMGDMGELCPDCDGYGCSTCNWSGFAICTTCEGAGGYYMSGEECSECDGNGECAYCNGYGDCSNGCDSDGEIKCPTCKGTGKV